MFKSLFWRKNQSRSFKDFYSEWIKTLKHTLLPLLRLSLSSTSNSSTTLLSKHVEMIHHHFQSYYDALDNAATHDVAQLLFPDWRNSLEKPFLWLGDLHPYLFAKLLRSFLDDPDEEINGCDRDRDVDDHGSVVRFDDVAEILDKPWHLVMAWNSPSKNLINKIDEIERGLRLIVPALAARGRHAHSEFIKRAGEKWEGGEGPVVAVARGSHARSEFFMWKKGGGEKGPVAEAVEAEMEEMVSIFVDANRIRRSVISEIISVTNVYQAAFFLEGLAQFLVGIRDKKLVTQFKHCKFPVS